MQLWSHHAQEVPTCIYGMSWAQKMSKRVIRQAASALAVKNSLILSIIHTSWVRSALICKQFSGSLTCSTGQAIPLLAYILRYFIVSHQLRCNVRLKNYIFIIISTWYQTPEGLKFCPFPKGRKKRDITCQWMRCVNQGSDSISTTSSCLMVCEWFALEKWLRTGFWFALH